MRTWKRSRDPEYAAKKAGAGHLSAVVDGAAVPDPDEPQAIFCLDEFEPLNLRAGSGRSMVASIRTRIGSRGAVAGRLIPGHSGVAIFESSHTGYEEATRMTTGNRWRMHGDSRGPGNPERLVRRRVVSLPDLRGAGTSVTDEDSGGWCAVDAGSKDPGERRVS